METCSCPCYIYIGTLDPPNDAEKYSEDNKTIQSNIKLLTNRLREQMSETAIGRRIVVRVPPLKI